MAAVTLGRVSVDVELQAPAVSSVAAPTTASTRRMTIN